MMIKGPSINDVAPRGEGGGVVKKQTKGDENWYLVLTKTTSFLTSQLSKQRMKKAKKKLAKIEENM